MNLKNRNIVSIIKRSKVTDYAALNLIQIMTYMHPLQMIKTLRAQIGSKTLTRVPPDEIASAISSEKSFSNYIRSSSFTIPVSSKYRCKKKNIEKTNFRLFVKLMYQDQSESSVSKLLFFLFCNVKHKEVSLNYQFTLSLTLLVNTK